MQCKIVLFALIVYSITGDDSIEQLCGSIDAQQSCGQCIKTHTDCAWCIDPHFTRVNRCQVKSKLVNESCTPHLIYSPQKAQVKNQQNLPLKSFHHDKITTIQLQPQATSVRLMPGDSALVEFKYLHQSGSSGKKLNETETMVIQTSDISQFPIGLKFFINCEGEWKETKSCRVLNEQIVEFRIEVKANSCSHTGDITLSIGILGQRTIAGVYVTTVCGCECEKHPEMKSRLCHANGHLVCGQCICDQNHGGNKCECPLSNYGVTKAIMLDEKCKFNTSSPVCSNSGTCNCGQCSCSKPTVSGDFCQCDNTNCPIINGKMCSGNGICDCGSCKCEMGWTHEDCSCSTSSKNCLGDEMTSQNDQHHDTTQKPFVDQSELEEETVTDDELSKKLDESAEVIQSSLSFIESYNAAFYATVLVLNVFRQYL